MLSQYKSPNRYRFLHFIRHGQYEVTEDLPEGKLTELGVRQSRHVANHLRDHDIEPAAIWCSTMSRAEETAAIICEEAFPNLEPQRTPMLREKLFPGHPMSERAPDKLVPEDDLLDQIFERWVRPSRSTRHELVVCHGNLIRAIAMKVLGADIELWHRPHLYHCSTTEVVVYDHDRYRLAHLNSYGYIPAEDVTAS